MYLCNSYLYLLGAVTFGIMRKYFSYFARLEVSDLPYCHFSKIKIKAEMTQI